MHKSSPANDNLEDGTSDFVSREAYNQLVAEHSEISQFSHVLSHDLRAPLRHINNLVQMISLDPENKLSSQSQTRLDQLSQEAKNLMQLINDLREISKNNLGNLAKEQIDSQEILDKVLSLYQGEFAKNQVSVTVDPLPRIFANPQLIWQLFDNLIRNALKHGSKPLDLRICHETTAHGTHFIFENSVDENSNIRPDIFDFSPKNANRVSSTGIGLFICKKVVALHEGIIDAHLLKGRFQIHIYLEEKQNDGN